MARIVRRPVAAVLLIICVLFVPFAVKAADWVYIIRDGDNLWDFSLEYLQSMDRLDELQALNGIENPRKIPPGTPIQVPIDWLRKVPVSLRVLGVHGAVSIVRGAQPATALNPETLLLVGDKIVTGDAASATLEFPNGSQVKLSPGSELIVESLHTYGNSDTDDLRFRLANGGLENRVEPRKNSNSRFEINSPSAVTGVRGTYYRIRASAQDISTRVEVIEGQVEVTSGGVSAEVASGFATIAAGGQPPLAPIPLQPPPTVAGIPDKFDKLPIIIPLPAGDDITGYRVQLYSRTKPDAAIGDFRVVDQVRVENLDAGGYRLKIRTIDLNGLEGRSASHTFTYSADSKTAWDLILFIVGVVLLL